MAQITAIPKPILFPRQIDFSSLLSAGLSVFSSILTNSDGTPTSTISSTATSSDASSTSATDSTFSFITSTPTSRQTSSRTTASSTGSSSSDSTRTSASSLLSSLSTASTASAASATSSPTTSHGVSKNKLAIILGVVLGVVALLLLILFLCLCARRRRKHGSFFNKGHGSPDLDSDGESYIGAGRTGPVAAAPIKETSTMSSAHTASSHSHNGSMAAPIAAAAIASHHGHGDRDRDREFRYPPLPAAHQMSSLGRRHSGEYAYVPNDPFGDGHRAHMGHGREPPRERERRSRHSLTLDPVREHPMRERSLSETRYPPSRRWTAGSGSGSGSYGTPPSPQTPLGRSIARKPVPSVNMSPGQASDAPFDHRRNNARGPDSDFGTGFGGQSGSRYPSGPGPGPGPGNPNRRFYKSGTSDGY